MPHTAGAVISALETSRTAAVASKLRVARAASGRATGRAPPIKRRTRRRANSERSNRSIVTHADSSPPKPRHPAQSTPAAGTEAATSVSARSSAPGTETAVSKTAFGKNSDIRPGMPSAGSKSIPNKAAVHAPCSTAGRRGRATRRTNQTPKTSAAALTEDAKSKSKTVSPKSSTLLAIMIFPFPPCGTPQCVLPIFPVPCRRQRRHRPCR